MNAVLMVYFISGTSETVVVLLYCSSLKIITRQQKIDTEF